MIQAKIKKGDLIKTKCNIWGSYWSHYGHVNFEIKKDMLFIAIADQVYIPEMSAAEVEAQFNAWKSGGVIPSSFSEPTAPSVPSGQTANYIADASRYRPTYDPSKEGRSRQAQIEQAVMCPLCHSALGIPSTRPIKVTCPSCMSETTFTN